MEILNKVSWFLNQVLIWTAGLFVGAMALLTCINILSRLIWIPISGTYELMGYLGAVATAFALGYTQLQKGHVAVDVLVHRFSRRKQKILDCLNCLVLTVFFSVVAWQVLGYGVTLYKTGEVTETLRIVYYPFTFAVAFGCAALVLAFLTQLLKQVLPVKEDPS